ncbi:MAG TPA: division/cell wall cluster transcriptional repressor MraZ [Burkholderiales bacterium]|nr:division/cell wall cluster transcriptional repressor MraZ [Burkholderiales bacterium]
MFQGAAELSLDPKGRLSIPTRHREALTSGGSGVVLTAHPDRCLLLYPRAAFAPISARISTLSSFNAEARWWQRLIVGFAEELALDGTGRILISAALRKFADLKKTVTLVGQGSHFEIWDAKVWEQKLGDALAMAGTTPPPGTENFSL